MSDATWLRRQFTRDADAVHDAAHAARTLLRTPGFTAITVLVFALGIGATTAIVSVSDALLMRPLPVAHADRVVTVWQSNRDTAVRKEDVAPGNALDWMKRARSFDAVAMAESWRVNFIVDGREPELLGAARVSEQFFTVLGVSMLHGRTFLPHEYQRGAGRVAVLSHAMWMERFRGDMSIIGTGIRLEHAQINNTAVYTIVGVMPPGLQLRLFDTRSPHPEPLVWMPKPGFESFEPNLRGQGYWNVLGRLAPGVSMDQVKAEFDAISAQLAREYPQNNASITANVVPLRAHLAGRLNGVLGTLVGAAALLLIVACANVANLLLARGVGRGREFAVRQALGASRGRLVRQMLLESLLLAAAGGAAGLALARWMLDAIVRLRPPDVARVDQIAIDARAAGIALGVTLLAALVAGLAPSIQLSRPSAVAALREGRINSRRGVRGALVVVEVAAALVVAAGAGLLVRSFMLIQRVDPGFTRDGVAVLQVFVSSRHTTQRRTEFFQQAIDRLRAVPGVAAAGAVSAMPFGDAKNSIRIPVTIGGRPTAASETPRVYTTVVGGDYFRAMGVPLVSGRLFDDTVTTTPRPVAVLSLSAARQLWPGTGPIGSRVQFRNFMNGSTYDAEVIGVVGEARHDGLDLPGRAELFVPHAHFALGSMTFVVRTAPGSPPTIDTLKAQISAVDPLQPFYSTAMLDQLVARTLVDRRFSMFLLGGFAVATLLLAAAGVYGVMSFSTSQRTREFGVRLALGATRPDIVRLVVGEGLKLAGLGVIVGILVALPLMQLLRTLLFGVTATDPVTFLSVSMVLVLTAAAACYLPASRAVEVDPVEALRVD